MKKTIFIVLTFFVFTLLPLWGMTVLSETEAGREIRMEQSPFFGSILEGLSKQEQRQLNSDNQNYYYCVSEIGSPDTRRFFKSKQFTQAETYFHKLVKQEFKQTLIKLNPGKNQIYAGKVMTAKEVKDKKDKEKKSPVVPIAAGGAALLAGVGALKKSKDKKSEHLTTPETGE